MLGPSHSDKTAITPTRAENYAEWYQQVIKAADLAEVSISRGCMTIKPWGYALWENMQQALDQALKASGHKNCYFPILIPLQFIQKEIEHLDGFAKECAIVTHHRLEKNTAGQLFPSSPLEEPYVIRPTSETIIGEAFSRWIQSYRDLPLLINQWANVVRWEMRPRLFLRTSEFLWQEGHTAHQNAVQALEETHLILDLYAKFAEEYMAMPIIKGEKSAYERFPGAVNTYCIEAMMQDKKALQAGTSHFLGQNFAKAFNITYVNIQGQKEYVWTTSWGVSTRLIGGLIMTHSDDDGLVLPPKLAPIQVVILPVLRKTKTITSILSYCESLASHLRQQRYQQQPIRVEVDVRDLSGGEKSWSWVKKGVPIRIEIGIKEVEAETICLGRRDLPYSNRTLLPRTTFLQQVVCLLQEMQTQLFQRAQTFLQKNSVHIESVKEFYDFFSENNGFVSAHWNNDPCIESTIKKELGVTIRCIPKHPSIGPGQCIFTGAPSAQPVIFAKAY